VLGMIDGKPKAPTGTVTFVFSDIEGSTVRWDSNRDAMQAAVRRHDELMHAAIESNNGYIFKTIGDAFCAAFGAAEQALAATLAAQRSIGAEDWTAVGGLRVRMAIHTGIADERNDDYFGPTVNRVARLLAIGHGGQVLVSGAARALIEERLTPHVRLLDLGMHRLKDLSTPERVFQLGAEGLASDFPPLRSLDAVPNNLPAQITALIGRDDELAEIKDLVERSRLVTMIGPGGIGKTRTALQVAADLARDDGAWFVDLASCEDPSLVPSAVAGVFDVADEGGSIRLIDRVATALKTKKLLIVLDNCEHVVGASAEAVDRLLQACPDVRFLATSREALAIAGEEIFRMPSLPVPPEAESIAAEEAMQYGAAALFVARARAAQKSFALTDQNAPLVADIVRRLDGIALAIELAAPRIKVLTLAQLSQRLDDRLKLLTGGSRTALPRQQTLRATIAWSYDLLGDVERSVLRQSAVFRGSWTLEAVEAVWHDDAFPEEDAFDAVAALVDKSLLVVEGSDEDEHRYRLLESTREYALERLDEAGEREDASARHRAYFSERAADAGRTFWETDSDRWVGLIRRDIENYRAAINSAFASEGDREAGAAMVANLRGFWWMAARREGRALVERARSALPDDAPDSTRGLLSLASGVLADSATEAAEAIAEAERLLGEGGDHRTRAEALVALADAVGNAGKFSEAVEIAERAVESARAARIARQIGFVLSSAAYRLACAGDNERSRALFDEAEPVVRRCDDRPALARLQVIRAEILFAAGDGARALECVREAGAIYRERRNEFWLNTALLNEAAYLVAENDLDGAWSAAREALQLAQRREDAFGAAVAIGHLARVAAESDAAHAARLLGFVDAAYARVGSLREPTERRGYDRSLELIRAAAPEDRIAALMAEGAALSQQAAAEEALTIPKP
jgi:predicted ATPase/class 3 adenylate cyclase